MIINVHVPDEPSSEELAAILDDLLPWKESAHVDHIASLRALKARAMARHDNQMAAYFSDAIDRAQWAYDRAQCAHKHLIWYGHLVR